MSNLIIDPNQPEGASSNNLSPVAAADLVKDGDTTHFTADVIDASMEQPVIVLFWVPDSEPCQIMAATLSKLVVRAGGLVKLVKLNVNDNQTIAQQLKVQSVPTVFVFQGGRPVDAFAGAQSETQLESFMTKLIGDAKPPIEAAMDQALELLNTNQGAEAEAIFTAILSQDSGYIPAISGLIRAIVVMGEFERADEILNGLDAKTRANVTICQAVSALELARQSACVDTSALTDLEQQVHADPKNFDARFALAQLLFASHRTEEAIDQLLEIVRLDRAWNDAAGRKQLIKIFDAIGPMDPVTIDARKRLSAILFS